MAAQDQALRTNSIKRIIDKQNVYAKCRMCGEGDCVGMQETCSKARQGGAGDSLGPMWKAGSRQR